ncbi:MAG: excinuclease ABC subunit UvrA [Pirellulaceae bacterium]
MYRWYRERDRHWLSSASSFVTVTRWSWQENTGQLKIREAVIMAKRKSQRPRKKRRPAQAVAGGTASAGGLRVRGARVHNLKNVDVDIPRNQLTVLTGPSGSGKSSLAFDTIYAEGQRQYIESLSVYARQFLHQLERPDVDLIEGLQPTICIDQRQGNRNPRSTVATVTEIYDYLRLLMARLGTPSCYQCGASICQQSLEQIQESLLSLEEGSRLMIMAPLVRGRRGQHKEILDQVRQAGFVRARVDGEVYDIDQVPELAPRKVHHVEAVIDRLIIREGVSSRLAESLQLAMQHGEGLVVACVQQRSGSDEDQQWQDLLFSTLYACPACGISFEELEPRTFSFNSPYGACATCDGLGVKLQFDPELVIADPSRSIDEGVIETWKGSSTAAVKAQKEAVAGWLQRSRQQSTKPFQDWSAKAVERFWSGDQQDYPGLWLLLEKEYATTTRQPRLERLERFRARITCETCSGSRLRPEATSVRLGDQDIQQITAMTVHQAHEFMAGLDFTKEQRLIADPITGEILQRLKFLEKVGADYLSLDRSADTLSGGELQRVRLATSIGSGLVGVCYVLDEPSIGLHYRDNDRLIASLRDLQQQGNTVLVVEHDEAMMRTADYLIDMGPGAGAQGGHVVAAGSPGEVSEQSESLTGQYLSGARSIPVPANRRKMMKSRVLDLKGASTNNLKNLDVQFPLGCLTCVTGVSGSGKSSLVNETLARALLRRLGQVTERPGPFSSLRGTSDIDKVVQIDQSPIGRTARSNAATYTGLFDEVRKVFANTRESKQRGYTASRFSFNVKSGRCPECEGHGLQRIEMNFLPDLFVTCNQCQGARYSYSTLQVRYRDRSIADVLAMSVDTAREFFESFSTIRRLLDGLHEVGLGYLPLGQPSTSLSGGEAQRIKLASQLSRTDLGKTLYLLDEPTTGLHFEDVQRLLNVLNRLVDRENTVIVIEHNLDVIRAADWVIDLGPEGGDQGGNLVACGPPEKIATVAESWTGKYLERRLRSP